MTSHFEVLDDASYVIGALSPADRQVFELHLSDCPICQASVQRLAGVPGLLALASPVDLEVEPPAVPTTLLPALLRTATRERHRRLIVLGGAMVAAAASLVALIIVLTGAGTAARSTVAGPAPSNTVPVSGATAASTVPSSGQAGSQSVWVDLRQLHPGPLSASVQLDERQWGTNLVLNCRYAEQPPVNAAYRLVVIDRSGASQQVGWWGAVTGTGSVINAATSLHRPDIARLEVQLRDGTPLLAAAP